MRYRTKRVLIAAVVVAAVLALGCSSNSEPSLPAANIYDEAVERGPYGVGSTTFEFVDESRPTEAFGETPGSSQRDLPVVVWYPAAPGSRTPEEQDAPIDESAAPYPLIVFAHGISAFPRQSASYTQHLASHGYIVVAPEFPLTHLGTPGGTHLAGAISQPGDVSFVIDEFLRMSDEGSGQFAGAIDESRIGVTGHSLGGFTALLLPYGPSPDERVRAVVAFSPTGCFLGDASEGDVAVPAMVVGGTADLLVGPASIRAGYDRITPPKYWAEIAGADHTRFADVDTTDAEIQELGFNYAGSDIRGEALQIIQATGADPSSCLQDGGPDDVPLISGARQRELMRAFATPFFDAYLKDREESLTFLRDELPGMVAEAETEFQAG